MAGTPKACIASDFRPRLKTSIWPFFKWILAPTKAILATFDFQRCQRAPYFASRSGWPDASKKYIIGMGRTPFGRYAPITQNSYRTPTPTRKQWIRRTCSG